MNYKEILKSIKPEDHYNVWTDEYKTLKKTLEYIQDYKDYLVDDFIDGDDTGNFTYSISDALTDIFIEDQVKWLGNPADNSSHFALLSDYISNNYVGRVPATAGIMFDLSSVIIECQAKYYNEIIEQDIRPLLLGIVKDQEGGTN
jgi:hypothetical protein